MKVKDILQQKHTAQINHTHYSSDTYRQQDLSLSEILTSFSYKWKDKIGELRLFEYHSPEQMAAKVYYPTWMVGGTFKWKDMHDEAILTYSNIIAIDIDKKDNPNIDIERLKRQLLELPYVFYVSKSISGEGIFALVLVEDGHKSSEYVDYIVKLWSHMFNLQIDKGAKGIGRKRYLSYDENAIMKDEDTDIIPWKLVPVKPIEQPKQVNLFGQTNDDEHIEWTRNAIWKVLNGGYTVDDRGAWFHAGCEFANFVDGFDMFKKFCDNYGEQRESITKKWNECLKTPSGINDELHRKWQGMAKKRYGAKWWKS